MTESQRGSAITNFYMLLGPLIKANWFYFRNVSSETAMDTTAVNTDEHTKIDISPVWFCGWMDGMDGWMGEIKQCE